MPSKQINQGLKFLQGITGYQKYVRLMACPMINLQGITGYQKYVRLMACPMIKSFINNIESLEKENFIVKIFNIFTRLESKENPDLYFKGEVPKSYKFF